jgi:predicted ester cyclase
MSTEINKAVALAFMERGFNQGDLSALDDHLAPDGVDHQEPAGTDYREHLKAVITMLRTAFPDLHFEIHHILAEGDIVAFHSTMTGTHLGALNLGPLRNLPPTGRKIAVAHMHFVRIVNGRSTDLWHVWDIPGLMRQLGMAPETQKQTA